MRHHAQATNWDGQTIEVTFTMSTATFDRLCKKAHDAFHRDGKYTIRLDMVDDQVVADFDLQYQ
jgi:hypothetical protein